MLGIETGKRRLELFPHKSTRKEELISKLENPPGDFDERQALLDSTPESLIRYDCFDLFVAFRHFIKEGLDIRVGTSQYPEIAIYLRNNKIVPVKPVSFMRRGKRFFQYFVLLSDHEYFLLKRQTSK